MVEGGAGTGGIGKLGLKWVRNEGSLAGAAAHQRSGLRLFKDADDGQLNRGGLVGFEAYVLANGVFRSAEKLGGGFFIQHGY